MIRLTASYPNSPDARFDFDYYTTKHMEIFRDRMAGSSLESVVVEKGVNGGAPDAPAPFVAVFTAIFSDVNKFNAAWGKAVPDLLGDCPNYTNTMPTVQIGEVLTK